ncbi:hypothetical protein SO802_030212 [Lithocarpus litseifolius]|uniref:Transmembrane protein n=1 Tax=Lithocarpus litseifolius TaxID=425828 RepID=A0AAW2BGW0_9ROSI
MEPTPRTFKCILFPKRESGPIRQEYNISKVTDRIPTIDHVPLLFCYYFHIVFFSASKFGVKERVHSSELTESQVLFYIVISVFLGIVVAVIRRLRMGFEERSEDRCTTPKRRESQIPVVLVCPPPPKKKSASGMKRDPPKNGYFQPPDLDAIFTMPPRREAWA